MHRKDTFYFRSPYFRSLFLFFPLSFLLKESPIYGAHLSLDDTRVIEASIAKEGLTRITVKNDRILNVFGLSHEYVLEADEDQGQVFIHPREAHDSPIHLTLTTEGGLTQDLRLLPEDKNPEALIFTSEALIFTSPSMKKNKAPQSIKNEIVHEKYGIASPYQAFSQEEASSEPLTRDEIELLLQACHEGRIPLGYKELSLPLSTLRGPHLLVRELMGERLRGLTFEVHNHSQNRLILSESEFAEACTESPTATHEGEKSQEKIEAEKMEIIAILMPQKILNPGERSFVHVVAKR